jgi:hypothetical protein
MQVFVRAASSCSAATPEVSATALNDAQMLYKQHPTIEDTTALAMVMASQGKFKEAQEYQAEAIFDAVRVADKEAAAMFKATMKEYVAKQKPERPWPPQHPYFKASMLTPATAPAAAKKS